MNRKIIAEELIAIVEMLEVAPQLAEALGRAEQKQTRERFPDSDMARAERCWPMECGYLESAGAEAARRLRALAKQLTPAKATRRAAKVALVIALLAGAGCVSDDDSPEPLPLCHEIGAPDSLLCNAAGVCTWASPDGPIDCCVAPLPGREPSAQCKGETQP